LRIDNPIATLVRCEGQLFLAVGSVTGLSLGSQSLDEINLPLLADASAEVSFQIIRLVRATTDDDPAERHDWRWSREMDGPILRVPGCLVQPLNPTLSSRGDKPTYLFESSELLIVAATIHEHFLPRVQTPRTYFVCEGHEYDLDLEADIDSCCPKCGPTVPLDFTKGQRVLEHFAAHQLHDPTINRAHEHCGLCGRPAPMCVFYLMKARGSAGGYTIDWERSICQRKVHFQYAIAAKSNVDGNSPCSNVPVICPTCGPKKPAPWKYNLEAHFRNLHKLGDPAIFPLNVRISQEEESALKLIWKNRTQPRKKKRRRKGDTKLSISWAHSTLVILR
ncbi:hypothetical protein B0H13DRAFT_1673161, partial [Mycena leptocephala]